MKRLTARFTNLWTKRLPGMVVAALFIVTGVAMLRASQAAVFTIGHEAEAGQTTGNVAAGDPTGASGKASIRFGVNNDNGSTCRPLAKADGGSWQCSFSDEFNGSTLSDIWSRMPYNLGDACSVLDNAHVKVGSGVLQLIATKGGNGCGWTAGGIQSQGKFAQQYGRFEIRAKLPAENLSWPAFWMMPNSGNTGEIDVLEGLGGDNEVVGGLLLPGNQHTSFSLHTPAGGPGPTIKCAVRPDYSSDFHTYALEWSAGDMKMLVDGKVCAVFMGYGEAGSNPPALPPVYQMEPFHILLDLAVQSYVPSWNIAQPTVSTMIMTIDYVRVWK